MKDILQISQKILIDHLKKHSKDVLYIDFGTKDDDPKSRNMSISDRVPSKKFDLIISNTIDSEKLKKYFNKYNKYIVILNNLEESLYASKDPKITLTTKESNIFKHFEIFENLASKHKELENVRQNLEKEILTNPLKLNLISKTKNDPEILIFSKNQENLNEILNFFDSKKDEDFTANIYNKILEEYSIGLDRRSLRFQKNMTYILNKLNRSSSVVFRSSKRVSKKTYFALLKKLKDLKKNFEKDIKAKNITKNNSNRTSIKENNFTSELGKKIEENINKIKINIYKRRIITPTKQLTYEEFLNKEKNSKLGTFSKKRAMQKFKLEPKISILMIIDDIDEIWLNKSVRSIKDQTYKNWEFIIVDNCSSRTYLKSYLSSLNDPRIRTYFYNSKRTYSECLNQAFKISKGDYVAILEEGDEIDIETLFHIVREINENNNVEYLYTDEDHINEQGKRVRPFIKPNWDPTMILHFPYAKNFLVARRDLIERIEPFKNITYKDPIWDLLLRVKESTKNISHIPLILYHKRIRPLKKEGDASPEALKNYMSRETIQGVIKESKYKGSFYIIKQKTAQPKVSIVTFNNNADNIANFIKSFSPNYKNYDIHIGSTKPIESIDNERVHIHLLNNFENHNVLTNLISKAESDYILTIDSRIRIEENPDFLDILISNMEDGVIAGTKIVDPEEIIQQSIYVKNLREVVSTLHEGQIDQNQFDISITRECSAISKKCMLIERKFFDDIGGFDKRFSASYFGIDLCFNANKAGRKVIYIPDAKVKTVYTYSKEKFKESDTIAFIDKWSEELKKKDKHFDIERMLTIKS